MTQMIANPDPGWAWLGTLLTTSFFATFVAWTVHAYAPWNQARHEANGRLPLEEDAP